MKRVFTVLAVLLALPAQANLNQWLQRQAEDFLKSEIGGDRLEVMVRPLDSRVRLPDCEEAWDFSLKAKSRGSAMVKASCGVTQVHLSATYSKSIDVVVAAQGLNRGDIIGPKDLELRTILERELRGSWHTDVDGLLGQQVKRNIRQGDPVVGRMVEPPTLVNRGDTVKLQAGTPGINITVLGKALSDAVEGEQVSVKNLASGRTVRGLVVAQGVVRMP